MTVSSKDFILERVRRCERLGGPRPNFIAVDIFAWRNVIGAVDAGRRRRVSEVLHRGPSRAAVVVTTTVTGHVR